MNPIRKFFDYLRYREAVQRADKAHQATGERYYVMPTTDGKLIIMDRVNFRRLRFKKYINRNATVADLVRECFYCTPYRNGNGYLDEKTLNIKRQSYYNYRQQWRKINRKRFWDRVLRRGNR